MLKKCLHFFCFFFVFYRHDSIHIVCFEPDYHPLDINRTNFEEFDYDNAATQIIATAKLINVYGEKCSMNWKELSADIKLMGGLFIKTLCTISHLRIHSESKDFTGTGREALLYNAGVLPKGVQYRYLENFIMVFTYPAGSHISFEDAINISTAKPETIFFSTMLSMDFCVGNARQRIDAMEDFMLRQKLSDVRRYYLQRLEALKAKAYDIGTGVHPIPYCSSAVYLSNEEKQSGGLKLKELIRRTGYGTGLGFDASEPKVIEPPVIEPPVIEQSTTTQHDGDASSHGSSLEGESDDASAAIKVSNLVDEEQTSLQVIEKPIAAPIINGNDVLSASKKNVTSRNPNSGSNSHEFAGLPILGK